MNLNLSSINFYDIPLSSSVFTHQSINNSLDSLANCLSGISLLSLTDINIEKVANVLNEIILRLGGKLSHNLDNYNDLEVDNSNVLQLAADQDERSEIYVNNGDLQSISTISNKSDQILLIDNYDCNTVYSIFIENAKITQKKIEDFSNIDVNKINKSIIINDSTSDTKYKLIIFNGFLTKQII